MPHHCPILAPPSSQWTSTKQNTGTCATLCLCSSKGRVIPQNQLWTQQTTHLGTEVEEVHLLQSFPAPMSHSSPYATPCSFPHSILEAYRSKGRRKSQNGTPQGDANCPVASHLPSTLGAPAPGGLGPPRPMVGLQQLKMQQCKETVVKSKSLLAATRRV